MPGDEGLSINIGSKLARYLEQYGEIELEDVAIQLEHLEFQVLPGAPPRAVVAAPPVVPAKPKPTKLIEVEFKPPVYEYVLPIQEVTIGATRAEGGTRAYSLTVGGEKAPPFYLFESPPPHKPVIACDVFDWKVPLAKAVKQHVKEVYGDPVAWAKLAVEKFGAELITLHLISIDPLIKDTPPKEAAKTVEEVLQAVDVPLIVGGCGDPKKDTKVFEKVAEVAEGERIVINSMTKEMLEYDTKRNVDTIIKHNHVTIAFTPMDMNLARELNRRLTSEGVPRSSIIMDTTTAALGYGIEYAFTIMQRSRLAGLMGDEELAFPISSGTTNAWAAREAWLKQLDAVWGPRELRGPIWETITALTLLIAGVDLFMMMHPAAMKTVRDVIDELIQGMGRAKPELIENWVSARM